MKFKVRLFLLVISLVIFATLDPCQCQDPPPPSDQNPPPPGGPGGGSVNEAIFPNLPAWIQDISNRMALLTAELTPTPIDDQENARKKKEGLDQLQGIEKGVKDPKLMQNKNQRAIANFLTEVEDKLAGIGRRMFGVRWNTIPCGAGYIHANCGKPSACPAAGAQGAPPPPPPPAS